MEERVRGREVRREDDNLEVGEHKGTTKRGLGRGRNRSTKQTLEGRRELEVQKVEQQKVQAEEQA